MIKRYLLFDLDGTLTNPKEGITKSLQYALHHVGIEVEDLDSLEKHIGPPLIDGLRDIQGLKEEEIKEATRWYREYFKEKGIFLNVKYEGIDDLLDTLVKAGRTLILATSKPEEFAREILVHFNLDHYFTDICGAAMDDTRRKKGDIIAYALKKNGINDKEQVVMIGDRLHDIKGARENGISSIGVLYGFGSKEELTEAGAGSLAKDLEELKDILLKE
ncbi:phosphoglycolate phosphatase [Anaerocolumna jejuensis DSM 15929]|uniref:Phosphoglycolate phosphatase n=1 Tax=Anaerocolumna jejuensis DSM 15929 TaxID=1121322 RepID=A0A1M6USM0_9FIRM|nr:HAD family hydrolase [Anaerocolumna jejuensis]SHK72121.1 phosphoglycolate phosphatase [Anaerocolumna jejuensis DSM 15929]